MPPCSPLLHAPVSPTPHLPHLIILRKGKSAFSKVLLASAILLGFLPSIIAWDTGAPSEGEWQIIQRLRSSAELCGLPFLLYRRSDLASTHASILLKPVKPKTLLNVLSAFFQDAENGTILIVDDDNAMRETLAEALTRAGYKVSQCADGKDVIDALKKESADLLITDLFMEETDGLGTIMNVRKEFPEMKIIAMSGGTQLTDHDYLPIAKRLGAHRTLHKPLNGPVLLKAIEELLPRK